MVHIIFFNHPSTLSGPDQAYGLQGNPYPDIYPGINEILAHFYPDGLRHSRKFLQFLSG
jgi:hypothetical protein